MNEAERILFELRFETLYRVTEDGATSKGQFVLGFVITRIEKSLANACHWNDNDHMP